MRITFVLSSFPRQPVGGFRVVYEYANRLAARGHHVSVIHPRLLLASPQRNLYRWLRRGTARIVDLSFPPRVDWQQIDPRVRMVYVPDLRARWVPEGDAIFATLWQTAEFLIEYPHAKGQKFYLVQDFDPWIGPKDRLDATWRLPMKKVAVSRWLYDKVCAAGAPESDVAHIPNGIDHQRFTISQGRRREAATIAMYYGVYEYKAPEDGLEALRQIKARSPHSTVTVFGHTDVRPNQIPSWAVCKGHVSERELVRIYNASQIFVCSSLAEGFALPPAEAMACGCAVASTDCGGIREFAQHEVTALLSPPRDPAALAGNIARLMEDDTLRQRLATAGHQRIQEFTWERSTDQLEQFIRQQTRK
jgi:glycosyltransferase involved in cell wall biosynthesis